MDEVNEATAFGSQLLASDMINTRQLLWRVVFCLSGLLLLALIAVVALAVTKRTVVVPFLVNELTGEVREVTTSVAALPMDAVTALDHSYINQYVIASERYTPATIEDDFATVGRFTCSNRVFDRFYQNVDMSNPNNYFDRYRNATVQPEIESINYFKNSSDIVEESTTIAPGVRYYTVIFSRSISGPTSTESKPRYSLVIGVDYTEKTEEAIKKRLNPFGFCVYSYDKTTITTRTETHE